MVAGQSEKFNFFLLWREELEMKNQANSKVAVTFTRAAATPVVNTLCQATSAQLFEPNDAFHSEKTTMSCFTPCNFGCG